MLKTLNEGHSLKKLTEKQYYQLLNLVNAKQKYSLAELQLLADLPTTNQLKPIDELTKFRQARDKGEKEPTKPQFDYVSLLVLVVMVVIVIKTLTN